ncbi:hypothetical protein SKAU_G00064590 [Synaphobranchus kaupii]|uniref:Uncharacterized protein n=1 Tax=Synaphobranchus kaupii TaxID=118154 RepID=A0A9Q1G6Q3_SYNKA|nr:hypothetical protein SKAU_G00064590 [Synaphobranchus kaupii]
MIAAWRRKQCASCHGTMLTLCFCSHTPGGESHRSASPAAAKADRYTVRAVRAVLQVTVAATLYPPPGVPRRARGSRPMVHANELREDATRRGRAGRGDRWAGTGALCVSATPARDIGRVSPGSAGTRPAADMAHLKVLDCMINHNWGLICNLYCAWNDQVCPRRPPCSLSAGVFMLGASVARLSGKVRWRVNGSVLRSMI